MSSESKDEQKQEQEPVLPKSVNFMDWKLDRVVDSKTYAVLVCATNGDVYRDTWDAAHFLTMHKTEPNGKAKGESHKDDDKQCPCRYWTWSDPSSDEEPDNCYQDRMYTRMSKKLFKKPISTGKNRCFDQT